MADSLCGPSNALKSFSGHINQDRSLQRDHAGPSESPQIDQFKTIDLVTSPAHDAHFQETLNGSNSGVLQEFGHGVQILHHAPPQPSLQQHGTPLSLPEAQRGVAVAPDWAAQFQQMSLGPQPTSPAFASERPLQQPGYPQRLMPPFMPLIDAEYTFTGQGQVAGDAEFSASMDEWMAQHGPRAEAVIDAEMESLARELEAEQIALEALQRQSEGAEELRTAQPPVETTKEPESQVAGGKSAGEDADELAAAARRIVEVMDTSQTSNKMKNSGFLSLMRRLADGDVKLQDQEFVDEQGTKINTANFGIAKKAAPSTDEGNLEWTPIDLTRPLGGG